MKWRGAQVSRDQVQKLYGARGADTTEQLMFFAASGFSKPAIESANQLGVALFTYDPLGNVTPQNDMPVNGVVVKRSINRDEVLWLSLVGGGVLAAMVLIAAVVSR